MKSEWPIFSIKIRKQSKKDENFYLFKISVYRDLTPDPFFQ